MKKILLFSFIFVLLLGNIQASIGFAESGIIASIGMKGLSMTNPEAAEAINTIICLSNPVVCAQGKIVGQVYGEAMQELAKVSPEAAKVVAVYNQVQEFVDMDAEIKKELLIDKEGEITEGTIQFNNEKEVNIGSFVGKNLNEKDVSVRGIEISKKKGGIIFTFTEKNSKACIKENCFENIKSQSEAEHPTYLELDEQGNVLKADFTTNERGGTYTLGGSNFDVPPNSRIYYTTENELKLPEKTEIKEITGSGKITGENIKLPTGHIMNSGTLSFDKYGTAFLNIEDKVTINNVEIENAYLRDGKNLNIFFDGENHEDSFVSFGKENLISQNSFEKVNILFKEDNPYIKIDGGDKAEIWIPPSKNNELTKIEITNRDQVELIPKVTITGKAEIIEDSKFIYIDERSIYVGEGNKEKFTTSPIEIVREGKNEKIFIDNANRIAMGVPENEEEFVSSQDGINTKFSARIKYNYIEPEDIKILTGKNIKFYDISEGSQDMVLLKFRDWYETLTPELKESFDTIKINDDIFKRGVLSKENAVAFAGLDKSATFRSDIFSYEIFRHELTHELHYEIREKWEEEIQKSMEKEINLLKEELNNAREKYHKIQNDPPIYLGDKKLEIARKEYKKINSQFLEKMSEYGISQFDKEWKQIAGDVYIGKVSIINEENIWEYKENPEYEGPKEGLVRPYGGKDLMEDVATFNEKDNSPSFFVNLINPHTEKIGGYDIRYSQKLDLKNKYGFISDEEYNAILSAAGVI